MRLPSPALVIAVIALFVALGGTSYAVTQLPKNSVGTKQLRKNAVTSAKVAAKAVTTAKIRDGAVTTTKIGNDAVTSDKIKDGTVTQTDLAADVVTSLKGAATSTYAYLPDALFDPTTHPALWTEQGTPVVTASITTSTPARVSAMATVNAAISSITGGANTPYGASCVVRIGGVDAGPYGLGELYFHGVGESDAVTIPTTGSAEVAAGTHAAVLWCGVRDLGDGTYPVLSRPTLTLIATPR